MPSNMTDERPSRGEAHLAVFALMRRLLVRRNILILRLRLSLDVIRSSDRLASLARILGSDVKLDGRALSPLFPLLLRVLLCLLLLHTGKTLSSDLETKAIITFFFSTGI